MGYGFYRFVSVLFNQCLDVPGSSTSAGTQLIVYPCTGGGNQAFYWSST